MMEEILPRQLNVRETVRKNSQIIHSCVWIDVSRSLGLGCVSPLAEIHGLLIENREACGINPEIGHPGFLRSRSRARRCDLAGCRRAGFCNAMAHPRGGDLLAGKRPDDLHRQPRPVEPEEIDFQIRQRILRGGLRSCEGNPRDCWRFRGDRHRPARPVEPRRRGNLPRAVLCFLLAEHCNGAWRGGRS